MVLSCVLVILFDEKDFEHHYYVVLTFTVGKIREVRITSQNLLAMMALKDFADSIIGTLNFDAVATADPCTIVCIKVNSS